MTSLLTFEEKQTLLRLARQALEACAHGRKLPPLDRSALTPALRADGASFVTLTINGELRGCIGALDAYQPLAEDVRAHAVAAAREDYRFPPVQAAELGAINVEVSRLTAPVPLEYSGPKDLIAKLRPHVDGVILSDGERRATFLPQVWDKLPRPEDFISNLCYKMGAPQDLWKRKHLDVRIYQVDEFRE